MHDSLTDIALLSFKRSIPFLSTLFFVLVDYVPFHIPLAHYLSPDLACCCVYFWVLYRLDLFGIFSVALLGMICDALSGAPFGMNIFVLTLVYLLTITYGRYVNTKPFIISWIGFALVLLAAFCMKWLLVLIYEHTLLSFWHVLISYIVTVLVYPMLARINIFIQNRYLSNEELFDE